jgi:hypothetical protein
LAPLIAYAAWHPRSQSVPCDATQGYHVPPNRGSISVFCEFQVRTGGKEWSGRADGIQARSASFNDGGPKPAMQEDDKQKLAEMITATME